MSSSDHEKATNYSHYLKVDDLLTLQKPLSDGPEHDELLFIIIHQVYELWFKQILHELCALQSALTDGGTYRSLALLGRVRTILKTCVQQIDILETMTPLQFKSFRDRLSSASGFQSAQFREIEVVLGRRETSHGPSFSGKKSTMSSHLVPDSEARRRVEDAMSRPSLWDSVLKYLQCRGYDIPPDCLNRDFKLAWEPRQDVQNLLVDLHRSDEESALVCEALVDLDEGLGEWRYRHVKMVERTIGRQMGTGGTSGVDYLASTLFKPVFPDLWAIRAQL